MPTIHGEHCPRLTPPCEWPWAMACTPAVCSASTPWTGALLRCWRGTPCVMDQPPLDHHYVVMHLGGAKHVRRRRDGPAVSKIVERGSLTLVPAGTAYAWRTEGPIAFAHLYLQPDRLADMVAREFDCEGRGLSLIDEVGCRDAVLEALFERMIVEAGLGALASPLRLDALLHSFAVRLARTHGSIKPHGRAVTVALAPYRLKRVLEFIDANLGRDVDLAGLAAVAGSSPYHFSRAFHLATGCSPYRYLLRRRIEHARVLLMTGEASLETVSVACGFNSRKQFAAMFKREVGLGPKRFGLSFGPGDAVVPPTGIEPVFAA